MSEAYTNCNRCPKGCPLTALSCGRGREYLGQLKEQGLVPQSLGADASLGEASVSGHGHGDGHGHGYGHGHGQHGDGHWEGHGHGGGCGHGGRKEERELAALLSACGSQMNRRAEDSMGQGRIMHILSERKEISQKELQDLLQIQPGSISETLSKMEQKGLIVRTKEEEDKRRSVVCLTEVGEQHIAEYRSRKKDKRPFGALSEEQQTQLKELLSVLLESWEQDDAEHQKKGEDL